MATDTNNQTRKYIPATGAKYSAPHASEPDPGTRALLDGEQEYLRNWRKERYGNEPEGTVENLAGLALSGGGIRSATFSMGVMQALAHSDLLKRFDYLSTVSGGGYIGSALTWLVSDYADQERQENVEEESDKNPRFGLGQNNFPFGSDDPAPDGVRNANHAQCKMLGYIRKHGNYLAPGAGISIFSLLGIVLRGMLLNLMVWIPVFILFFLALFWIGGQFGSSPADQHSLIGQLVAMATKENAIQGEAKNLFIFNGILWFAIVVFGILLAIAWVSSFLTFFRRGHKRKVLKKRYKLRRATQKVVAALMPLGILLLVIATLPVADALLFGWREAGPAAMLTGITVLLRGFLKSHTEGKGLPTGVLVSGAAALFLYGVFVVSFQIAHHDIPVWFDVPTEVLFLALFAFITGWFVNLNLISIHRFYRDRLMETFMPDISQALKNKTGAAMGADTATIQGLGNKEKPRGPYHIVNTNVVLVNSDVKRFEVRGGDNFILSPQYCGSSATGWSPTEEFMDGSTTLATAVAVSGAAANPNTGVGGEGLTRTLSLSLVMSLLNFKLGYWAGNPKKSPRHIPNHFRPGSYSFGNALGFKGLGFNEERAWIQLSDGGHFENTGMYELIRRRAKLIVACDGGADADFSFSDLQTTVRRIEDDFGARLKVLDDESPDQTVPVEMPGLNYPKGAKFSKQGHMLAEITYADGSTGLLIYLKTTLMEGVSFKVKGYAAQNPTFPDQSTADQFFDEVQFEAYRELGYRIAHKMLNSEVPAEVSPQVPAKKFGELIAEV